MLGYLFNGLMNGGIYVLIALGLTMVYGILDILNFAHGQFMVMGAYATHLLTDWLGDGTYFLALLGAVLIVGLIGMLVERVVFRPALDEPLNALIVSLGLIIVFQQAGVVLFTTDPISVEPPLAGTTSFLGVRLEDQQILVFLLTAVVVLLLVLFLRHSRWGTAIRATAQNKTAARLMGVDVGRVATVTFIVSAMMGAAAGGLLVTLFTVTPFSGDIVSKAFAIVILGGLGSVPGAVVGGLILGVAESLGGAYVSTALQEAMGFIVVLVVLVVRPQGIVARVRRVG